MPSWQSLLLALGFFSVILLGLKEWNYDMPEWIMSNIKSGDVISPNDNNIHQLGIKFMTQYVLPFEVISIFLLMALIGAAHLSRKEDTQ